MRIEATCSKCGKVAETTFWSRAVTHAATHEHQPVSVVGVMTKAEWRNTPRDYKSGYIAAFGRAASDTKVLHRDSDGSTILIPVEVR